MLFFDSPYYRFGVDEADKNTQSQNQTSGSNRGKGWKKWWKTTLSTEDYLKFIASKVNMTSSPDCTHFKFLLLRVLTILVLSIICTILVEVTLRMSNMRKIRNKDLKN